MKYQLFTTLNKNPGDEFIRVGVENIIKKTDKDAEFILTDKEEPGLELIEADKYIWCGMPLIWDVDGTYPDDINWWDFLVNEFSVHPNSEIWGAGSCVGKKYNLKKLKELISQIKCKVTSRDYLLSEISGWKLEKCPAFFSTTTKYDERYTKLCNWSKQGGHYILTDLEESEIWNENREKIINKLTPPEDGWIFVAHNSEEFEFGIDCGFEVVTSDYKDLLEIYSCCRGYIGNRVHGGIASRGAGAKALIVGWESRMFSISPDNSELGRYAYPSELL